MEEYAAVQTEIRIANELDEATRQDHYGNFEPMNSPITSVRYSPSYTRYYLMGVAQFGPGWGTGSGLNEGSHGGASAAGVANAGLYLAFFGGGQPGEGSHPVPFELN